MQRLGDSRKRDAYMPALNQLALYYFDQAKKRVGAIRGREGRSISTSASIAKRADVQQLELAALVASQAMQKNPGYAPIYNTAGLVQNELGKINLAVQHAPLGGGNLVACAVMRVARSSSRRPWRGPRRAA
jgi:hypothetical protein